MEVLIAHGVVESDASPSNALVQRCFDICAAQERRIEKAVLHYGDFESQLESYFDEIETILFEQSILTGEKKYRPPADFDDWED